MTAAGRASVPYVKIKEEEDEDEDDDDDDNEPSGEGTVIQTRRDSLVDELLSDGEA